MDTSKISPQSELFIKMALTSWDMQHAQINKILGSLSDEQLLAETAPGRNRGIYLLGHLTAVSDLMLTLLGSERLYPQLDAFFIRTPDRSVDGMPSPAELRAFWNKVNEKVTLHLKALTPDDWFSRHNAVSAEDFAKEPHRNKLNLLLNRTNHTSYHLGQLVYLQKK